MRKHLYILLVLVAIVSAYMVACKNKPTAMAEFIEEPTAPTTISNTENKIPTPIEDNTYKNSANLKDYNGKTYTSKGYYINTDNVSGTFVYTLEVKQSTDANGGTIVVFKGYEKGAEFTRTYTGTTRNAANKFPLTKVSGSGDYRADIEFDTFRYAHFKPANYNFTIKAGLTSTN